MARYKRGAKSQAIRDQLQATPDAMPKEIVAAIKSQGMKVTSQMVSTLRSKLNNPPKKKRRKKRKVAGGEMVAVETLLKAKKLAEQLGGLDKAREAIDALAKLQ